jgi:hypothetical protein
MTVGVFRQFLSESLTSSVKADRNGVHGAVEHRSNFGVAELLPGRELQQLGIRRPQPRQDHLDTLRGVVLAGCHFDLVYNCVWSSLMKPSEEPFSSEIASMCVSKYPASDRQEPWKLIFGRYVLNAPPSCQEYFRNDIFGGGGTRASTERIREDPPPVPLKE